MMDRRDLADESFVRDGLQTTIQSCESTFSSLTILGTQLTTLPYEDDQFSSNGMLIAIDAPHSATD